MQISLRLRQTWSTERVSGHKETVLGEKQKQPSQTKQTSIIRVNSSGSSLIVVLVSRFSPEFVPVLSKF